MAATFTFANDAQTTAAGSSGTTSPGSGTPETWTVTSSAGFPAASTGVTQFAIADVAAGFQTEVIMVTNVSGTTWTVTRGAESTTPVAHLAGATYQLVVSAGFLTSLGSSGFANPMTTLGDTIYENAAPAAARLAGSTSSRKKRLTQTGNGSVSAAPAWAEPSTAWINVVDQGADPTGVADSGTAIAAAIAALPAGGGTVYFPAGTYKNNTAALTPVNGLRITGDGWGSTSITSTANSHFNCATAAFTESVEIDHIALIATGAHVFTGANCARWKVHECNLVQNSAGFGIWNASITTQIFIECVFEHNRVDVAGATRTVEAWFLTTTSGASNAIAHNTWQNNVTFNNGNDTAEAIYHLQSTSNVNNSNSFINETFEHPYGGMIWLESHSRGTILHCYAEDLSAATVSRSLIYISKNATGGASSFNTIINAPRIASGVTFAGSISDIQLDSNCIGTLIENPQAPSGTLILDVGNSALVTLLGLPTGFTLNNHATATWGSARLANGTPATPVSFQPGNPSSTVSTTLVMMGLGTTCVLTPLSSGKVLVNLTGVYANLTAANNVLLGARFGTGGAPANGVAVTGTRFGSNADSEMGSSLSPISRPFAFTDVLALTPGTAYWFDIALASVGGVDAAVITSVSMTFVETS